MHVQKPLLVGVSAALGLGLIVVGLILLTPPQARAVPTITWTPASISEEIGRGQSKPVVVSFTASESIENVEVQVVPELQPFVQLVPQTFARIAKGQSNTLQVLFSASASAPFTTFDGTLNLRKGQTFAKPLPVRLTVVPVSPEEVLSELSLRLKRGDISGAQELIVAPDAKLAKLQSWSQSQLASLADFYANGTLVEEHQNIRVYRSFLRENDGSVSQVTFRLEKDESGRWRIMW